MKQNASTQLDLYRQLTRSANLAEVQRTYRSIVKPSGRSRITTLRDVFEALQEIYSDDKIEHIKTFHVLLFNRDNKYLSCVL